MDRREQAMSSVNAIAATIVVVVSLLLPPVAYTIVAYAHLVAVMETEDEIHGAAVSAAISAAPQLWTFQEVRFTELLSRTDAHAHPRPTNCYGSSTIKAHSSQRWEESPAWPIITRKVTVFDAGRPVGRLEVAAIPAQHHVEYRFAGRARPRARCRVLCHSPCHPRARNTTGQRGAASARCGTLLRQHRSQGINGRFARRHDPRRRERAGRRVQSAFHRHVWAPARIAGGGTGRTGACVWWRRASAIRRRSRRGSNISTTIRRSLATTGSN